MTSPRLVDDLGRTRRTRALVEELIADPGQLGPDLQPVRRLTDDAVVGWKATGRGRPGTELADTLALLDEAASLGLVERRACPPRLAVSFGRGRRELVVAAEVHADGLADLGLLERAVAEMRGWGWQLVLADVADERDARRAVELVRPDVVQVDLARPGRVTSSAVAAYLEAGLDAGAEVMALGVDSASRRSAAVALGATLGRGSLLGEPGPVPT